MGVKFEIHSTYVAPPVVVMDSYLQLKVSMEVPSETKKAFEVQQNCELVHYSECYSAV